MISSAVLRLKGLPYFRLSAGAALTLLAGLACAFVLAPGLRPSPASVAQRFSVLSPSQPAAWDGFLDSRSPWGRDTRVSVTLFNLTNAAHVLENGTAVELQEVGPMYAQRHRLLEVVRFDDEANSSVVFQPTFLYDNVVGLGTKDNKITSVYMPLIVLFAHGYAPADMDVDVGVGGGLGQHVTAAVARGTRAGRLLSGACDHAAGKWGPDVAAADCLLTHEAQQEAVSYLRGVLGRARWLLAHTLELLPAETWRVPPPNTLEALEEAAAAREAGDTQGQTQSPPPEPVRTWNGLDMDLLASGTAAGDAALLSAFPALGSTHPLTVVMTGRARAAYAKRPGLGRAWADMLFTRKTGHGLLWGYADSLYYALNQINGYFPERYPGLLGNSSFGAWTQAQPSGNGKGHKSVGHWSVRTGALDPHQPGARDMTRWWGANDVQCCSAGPCSPSARTLDTMAAPAWASPIANTVNSSLGDAFHAGVSPDDTLNMWVDRLARSIPLRSMDAAPPSPNFLDPLDIPTLRFKAAPATFLSAQADPGNAAYHSFGPTGLLNTTTCEPAKVPVFHSLPYFLHGNASALNAVSGLPQGDPSTHDLQVDVEPISGQVLRVYDRWQINVWIADQDGPPSASAAAGLSEHSLGGLWPNLRPLYLPLIWMDATSSVGPGFRSAFAGSVVGPMKVAAFVETTGLVAAGVAACVLLLSMAGNVRGQAKAAAQDKAVKAAAAMAEVSLAASVALELRRLGRGLGKSLRGGSGPAGGSSEDGMSHRRPDSQPLLPSFDSADGSASVSLGPAMEALPSSSSAQGKRGAGSEDGAGSGSGAAAALVAGGSSSSASGAYASSQSASGASSGPAVVAGAGRPSRAAAGGRQGSSSAQSRPAPTTTAAAAFPGGATTSASHDPRSAQLLDMLSADLKSLGL